MSTLLNTRVGEYQLIDFLGAGGMGEVYRAVHAKIGRVVAIKVLTNLAAGSGGAQRFINEARIQARLQHQNIATLYDFLEINGRPCIVMEYVDGRTLEDRIKASGGLAQPEAVYIFREIVAAIAYLHGQRVVHRDIKSNNIKISGRGQVKLLDFGIARDTATPRITVTGHTVGTLQYLSPEQILGKTADMRSDVWSLGVLLFEMITARLPFESNSISELCDRVVKAVYPKPSLLNPAVSPALDDIVANCLKRNPRERYASASELLQAVQQVKDVVASPRLSGGVSSLPYRILRSFGGRNRQLLGGLVIVLLLLLAAIPLFYDTPYPRSEGLEAVKPLQAPSAQRSTPVSSSLTSVAQKVAPVKIETFDGVADVYMHGELLGKTPYVQNYAVGTKVDLELKRKGYQSRTVQFEVREIGNHYSYGLDKENLR